MARRADAVPGNQGAVGRKPGDFVPPRGTATHGARSDRGFARGAAIGMFVPDDGGAVNQGSGSSAGNYRAGGEAAIVPCSRTVEKSPQAARGEAWRCGFREETGMILRSSRTRSQRYINPQTGA